MRYMCPCCNFYTLREESDDICQVCAWQDDIVQKEAPDYSGGPNGVSLNQARSNYALYGAINEKFVNHVRKPLTSERIENNNQL